MALANQWPGKLLYTAFHLLPTLILSERDLLHMVLQRETEELLTEFAENPGAERSQLEFKSKDVLQSTEQKKKVVRTLSAMANQAGGTMIIGVRHQDDDLLYQSFTPNDEPRQELTHIAQQYTSPQLQTVWDISFDECLGHRFLRIDVDHVQKRLIQVDYEGEYQVWIRDEDGMREMTTAEIDEFYQRRARREEAAPSSVVERTEHVDFTPVPVSSDNNSDLFERRGSIRTNNTHTVVFGFGFNYDYLRKSHTIRLRTQFPGRNGYADIPGVLDAAEDHLGEKMKRQFGYSIRVADLHLIGRSTESLHTDLGRLDDIFNRLDDATERGWNYGPVIAGVLPVDHGLLWFELQRETQSFTRSNLGLILKDIPFDDSSLETFYDEIGTSPPLYDHRHGLQFVTFQGSQVDPLQNPTLAPLTEADLPGPLYITADNPFSNWPQTIQSELEDPIPDHLTNGLGAIDRIPFQVSGGYLNEGEDRFSLNYLHFTQVQGIHPTLLVDAMCWQG